MRHEDSLRQKSLQDIDGEDWGEPTYPSYLVTEYHRLRRVPLGEMEVENLRLLIGQALSLDYLEYLLPFAFAYLQNDPWVSGAYYDGDLLKSVLGIPVSFWHSHADLHRLCSQIVHKALAQATKIELPDEETYDARVLALLRRWKQGYTP